MQESRQGIVVRVAAMVEVATEVREILKVKDPEFAAGHGRYMRKKEKSRILWMFGPEQLLDNLVK